MNLEELKKTTVTLGTTRFTINKLSACAALELLERTRVALATTVVPGGESDLLGASIFTAIAAIPVEFSKDLRRELFKKVQFRRSGDSRDIYLTEEMWDMAFEGLEASDIYNLMLRALVVNFFYSFEKIKKDLEGLQSLTAQKQHKL